MKFCILLAVVLGLVSANHDPSFSFYPYTDGTNGSFLIANNSGKYGAVGVTKTSGATFPDVVVACMTPKDTIECVGFKCSAAEKKCTEDSTVMKFALQDDKGVGAVTFIDVGFKAYASILWFEAAAPSKLDATSVAGKTWEAHPVTLFTATLVKSDFPYVVTVASDKDETKIMIDSGASSFGAVGFRKDGNADFPVYFVMCTTSQDNCMDADCTKKDACTIPTTSNLKTVTTDKKNGKWEVTTKSTSTLAAPSKFSLTASFMEEEVVAKLEVIQAAIQDIPWKFQVVRTSNSGPPTAFTPVFSRPSATTLGMSIATPPVGQTIFFGWKTATGALFPSDAIICAPNFVATCLDVSCTADTCQTRAATILTTNTVTATSISIVRAFVGTTTLAEGTPMYLIWDTAPPPAAPVLTADQAHSRANWSSYDVALPAFTPTTTPTFPINFTRPSETTLSISMPTPPAGQTIFFGWRSAEIVGFPADAVICAPSFVATCLDVSCTAAATCATRATSIFTENTVTATSVALTRTLASGNAPIVAGSKMWLAYNTAATATGTTTLTAASAQSRTWSYYSADVPAVGSDAKMYIPTLIAALCALLCVL